MKYWDTSALLRPWKEGWIPQDGMTRTHTIAEWLSIQTGRGLVYVEPDGTLVKKNLSAAEAAIEVRRIFQNLAFHDLSPEQVFAAADAVGKRSDIAGAAVHDFLHVRAAEVHNAVSIVSINHSDFSRMTTLPLEHPAKPTAEDSRSTS